jgi:signal transduction histidine kinase
MGLRHRSIRLRVGILIVVPVLCLIGLYAFVASLTVGNARTEANSRTLKSQLLTPLGTFETQIYKERHIAVLVLATPNSTQLSSALGMQENSTRQALVALEQDLGSATVRADATAHEQAAIATLLHATGQLSAIRTDVGDSAIGMTTALADYSTIVGDANEVIKGILDQQSSVPIVTQALDIINLDEVAQTTLEESDLLDGEMARGQFPVPDRMVFAGLAADRSSLLADTLPQLDPGYRNMLSAALTPALSNQLANVEAAVIATPWRHGPPAPIVKGSSVFGAYTGALTGAVTKIGVDLENNSQQSADDVFTELYLAAGLGLLGILISVVLSLYIGRSLVRQLRTLRQSALGLATDKLPQIMRQLREGEAVDLSDYAVSEETPTRDEVEQVQRAFNMVQQTAVQAAVDEARLRRGISDVFRNLAGRSQSLLHRQLTLLDGMERRATEPGELEDLFRIDHLTTRMRRHAEGLIILSGEAPARGWRQPVPLIDVLRAAVAEVEDYTRIRVFSRTRSAVAGHAVADVIHLIAELAENATVFSPPNTPVRIQGDVVGRGIAIEIEDRGLGISPDRLAELNADLANPRQFDLSDSDRLGLFITAQLARRHDVTVSLQPSVYGGTTAIVLLPTALVVDENAFGTDHALEAGSRSGQHSGRHAALAGAERGLLTTGNGEVAVITTDPGPASLPSADGPIVLTGTRLPQRTPTGRTSLPPAGLAPDGYPPPPDGGPADGRRLDGSQPDGGPADDPWSADLALTGQSTTTDRPAISLRPDGLTLTGLGPPGQAQATGPRPGREHADAAEAGQSQAGWSQAGWPPSSRAPERRMPDTRTPETGTPGTRTPDEQDRRVSASELAELGLPVRVRQASLAPQLRQTGPAMTPAPTADADAASSPEAVRNTMSALQRGWRLGRAEANDPAAGGTDKPGAAEDDLPRRPADSHADVFQASADRKAADAGPDDATKRAVD